MERRDFLRGVLVATSAVTGEALVKLATPREANALTLGAATTLGQPTVVDWNGRHPNLMHQMAFIQAAPNRFVPIGPITGVHIARPLIDVTTFADAEIQLVPGIWSGTALVGNYVDPETR